MADNGRWCVQKYMSRNFSVSAQTKQMKFYVTDAEVMNTNAMFLVHIFLALI